LCRAFAEHCPIVRGDIKGCEICTGTYSYGCQCCQDVKYENIFLDCNSLTGEMIGKISITPFLSHPEKHFRLYFLSFIAIRPVLGLIALSGVEVILLILGIYIYLYLLKF